MLKMDGEAMSQNQTDEHIHDDELHERPPEFDPQLEGEYRSPVLMRVMLVVINIASLFFCRSFMQSWYSIHGTTPIWISLVFCSFRSALYSLSIIVWVESAASE